MKFASWNVNGLRACTKKGFPEVFREIDADIFAIQETKMQPDQLEDSHRFAGYEMYMHSAERKGYSGTLIYTRRQPLSVSYDIGGDDSKEGRVITMEFEDFWFVTAYVPNSKEGLARLPFRLEWEKHLRDHLVRLDQTKPVIYTGDLNVAHEEIDLKNPDSNHFNAGFSDEERAAFGELLGCGFTDTFRYMHPEEVAYSWWSYRFHAREKNIGWRIDYFVVSDRLRDRLQDSAILSTVEGSDHCPITLTIQD